MEHEHGVFIAMEFVEGELLSARTARGPRREGVYALWLVLRVTVDYLSEPALPERAARRRLAALDARQLVHVGADLEDGARRHVPRQLRVGHLVVPRPEGAVRFVRSVIPAKQEVGVPAPAPVEEGSLVDDVGAVPHRVDRLGRGLP